jgi:hypothetical protein
MTGADLQVEAGPRHSSSRWWKPALGWCIGSQIGGSQLVSRLDYFQHDQKGPITRAQLLARAWKLANDKARDQVRSLVGEIRAFSPPCTH